MLVSLGDSMWSLSFTGSRAGRGRESNPRYCLADVTWKNHKDGKRNQQAQHACGVRCGACSGCWKFQAVRTGGGKARRFREFCVHVAEAGGSREQANGQRENMRWMSYFQSWIGPRLVNCSVMSSRTHVLPIFRFFPPLVHHIVLKLVAKWQLPVKRSERRPLLVSLL